jgi:superfamily II DNA or RNA helicase
MEWQRGDRLTVRGGDWEVVRATAYEDCAALDLDCATDRRLVTTLLVPFDRPRRARRQRPRSVSCERWRGHVVALLSRSYPFGGLRHVPPGIQLLAYQLEPALAIFRHACSRLLIADDVGLGKTVEAGVIVKEVAGRSSSARILIVLPASLKAQWRDELAALFGVTAVDANAEWLRRAVRELPPDVNPWSIPGTYLASMDFVKRAEALSPLENVRWDLLVVDEVHNATPATDRLLALNALADRSRVVVLLSATPHSGNQDQFDALCAIGAAHSHAPLLCFRRSRVDAGLDAADVRSKAIAVRLSSHEHHLHRLLETYTSRLWSSGRERADGNPALLATLLRKRALSSSTSLAISLRRRLLALDSTAAAEFQPWLPMDDTLEADGDAAADRILGGPGLADAAAERRLLEETLLVADAAALTESKARVLLRLLARVGEAAVVFSEFRDTAQLLFDRLRGAGHHAVLLHGALSSEERLMAAAAFRRDADVLVATDAASEGLNLHHRSRLVVHYELPWSPSRLHQRCGRVNRIGQRRRVHEIALVAADTAEQFVLAPLLRRAAASGLFTRATIFRQLPETSVAAHIFAAGGAPLPHSSSAQPPEDSRLVSLHLGTEAREEVARLALLRRLTAGRHAITTDVLIPVARGARRIRGNGRFVMLATLALREAGGDVVEETVIPFHVDCPGVRWRRHGGALRWQVEVALPALERRLASLVRQLAQARLAIVTPLFAMAATERHARSRALANVRSQARQLVQPGLFTRTAAQRFPTTRPLADALDEDDGPARGSPRLVWEYGGVQAVYCGELP